MQQEKIIKVEKNVPEYILCNILHKRQCFIEKIRDKQDKSIIKHNWQLNSKDNTKYWKYFLIELENIEKKYNVNMSDLVCYFNDKIHIS